MGTVLAVLGVLGVLFVAALVGTRDGEILVDAPRDRPDPDLPLAGPVRADDLERVRFGMALRGYRMSEVDDLLDRVAAELRERDDRIEELQGGPVSGGELPGRPVSGEQLPGRPVSREQLPSRPVSGEQVRGLAGSRRLEPVADEDAAYVLGD